MGTEDSYMSCMIMVKSVPKNPDATKRNLERLCGFLSGMGLKESTREKPVNLLEKGGYTSQEGSGVITAYLNSSQYNQLKLSKDLKDVIEGIDNSDDSEGICVPDDIVEKEPEN